MINRKEYETMLEGLKEILGAIDPALPKAIEAKAKADAKEIADNFRKKQEEKRIQESMAALRPAPGVRMVKVKVGDNPFAMPPMMPGMMAVGPFPENEEEAKKLAEMAVRKALGMKTPEEEAFNEASRAFFGEEEHDCETCRCGDCEYDCQDCNNECEEDQEDEMKPSWGVHEMDGPEAVGALFELFVRFDPETRERLHKALAELI